MTLAKDLLQQQSSLESARSTWEQHWAEIAPLVLTRQDDFFNERRQEGERRTKEKFDDTASLALERGSAAIESILAPRGQMWHGIKVPDAIAGDREAQIWAEDLTKFLFKKRYETKANFASQFHETIMSLLAFGTGVLIVEDIVGFGVRYKSSHISEHYIMENAKGVIDTDYRKYRLTARQAAQRFKERTPEKVLKCLEKEPNKKMDFLHVVMPSNGEDTDMEFVSYHVSVEDAQLIDVGGFDYMPYIISRWNTAPNEVYGRSPAMTVLSEIKMLNAMRKTDLKARHMAIDPPILAADQHTIRRFSLQSGKINYGSLDANGTPLVRPYRNDVNIPASNDGIQQSREFINDAFFVTLFQILVDNPQMTATEVLQRAQEKGALLSPTAGRQLTELMGPMIEAEIRIYDNYGVFEDDGILPMPESLKEQGGAIDIEYTNPITKMQQSEEALNTERVLQALIPFAELGVLEKVDFNEYAEIMRRANNAPAKLFKSPEQIQQEEEAKAQQQAMQQMIEGAAPVAGAMKDLAQAEKLSRE